MNAVAAGSGLKGGLKRLNDVLVGGSLAGILAELSWQSAIVVGIGLNVMLRPEEIGEPEATSSVTGVDQPDRTALIRVLLEQLDPRLPVAQR